MLNKKVCKKCCKTHWFGKAGRYLNWDSIDESNWNDWGFIECPSEVSGGGVVERKIKEMVPEYCKYQMEHMIMNQNEIS